MRAGSGYFSPKSIIAPAARASASGTNFQWIGSAAATRSATSCSIGGQLLGIDRRGVAEIEPQPIVLDLRAHLMGVFAEVLLQGVVQDVRGRVGAANALPALVIDAGGDFGAGFHRAVERGGRSERSGRRLFACR